MGATSGAGTVYSSEGHTFPSFLVSGIRVALVVSVMADHCFPLGHCLSSISTSDHECGIFRLILCFS